MAKFKPRYFKPAGMNTENNFMVGFTWQVEGSKGNLYEIELHHKGLDCSCPGFGFHGNCKHVKAVVSRLLRTDVLEYKAA